MILLLVYLLVSRTAAFPTQQSQDETDGETSRKVLGSSVVTSVSVILDSGNGSQAYFADAAGKPVSKPQTGSQVASPINLLNPDRYEFYTFDDNGDLVKRLMTLDEIQGIIANGDGEIVYNSKEQDHHEPERHVDAIVNNIQNVLKEEMETHKPSDNKPVLDTPDVSSTWSMILPAIFGNSGEDIKPGKPNTAMTPDTIMLHELTTITNKPDEIKTTTQDPTTSKANQSTTSTEATTMIKIDPVTPEESKPLPPTKVANKATTQAPIIENIENTELKAAPVEQETTKQTTTTTTTTVRPTSTTTKPTTTTTTTPTTTTTTTPRTTTTPTTTTTTTTTTTAPLVLVTLISNDLPPTKQNHISDSSASTTEALSVTTTLIQNTSLATETESTSPVTFSTKQEQEVTTEELKTNRPTEQILESFTTTEKALFKEEPLTHQQQFSAQETSTVQSLPTMITEETESNKETVTVPITTTDISVTNNDFIEINQTTLLVNSTPTGGDDSTSNKPASTTTISQNPTTTEEPFTATTTKIEVDDNVPKVEIAEILNQLLLSTTNIYEINTELTQIAVTTKIPSVTDLESVASTSTITQGGTEEVPLTTTEEISKTSSNNHNELTPNDSETTSTENDSATTENLISSIEQLISQASISQPTEILNAANASANIEDVLENSKLKPMSIVQEETATVASQLLDAEESANNNSIADAFNSLISQISETVSTTIENELNISSSTSSPAEEAVKVSTVRSTSGSNVRPTIAYKSDTELELLATKNKTVVLEQVANKLDVSENINNEKQEKEDVVKIEESIGVTILTTIAPKLSNVSVQTEEPKVELVAISSTDSVANEDSNITYINIKTPAIVGDDDAGASPSTENYKLEIILNSNNSVINDTITVTPTDTESTTKLNEETFTPTTITPTEIFPTLKTINDADKVINNSAPTLADIKDSSWTLVSTVAPTKQTTFKPLETTTTIIEPPKPVNLANNNPLQGFGLEDSTSSLDTDVYRFVELCNELAFGFWKSVTNGISNARSVIVSPFAATSLLAMVFLGARGATSGEMNEILKLDDMVTFNPHLIFKNVSESIEGPGAGIAVSSIIRELYSDRSKGKLLNFYKERAKQFYDGYVEEASYKEIGDIVRRRTNLIVKRQSGGKIQEFVKDIPITLRPPLAGVSASIFQTDCSEASTEGRDGELYFIVLPTIRQRRLIPVPAAVWRKNFLAGYDPILDATAVSIGIKDQTVSTIYVLPGQQGIAAPGDGLNRLEKRLVDSAFKNGAWSRLLRTLIPRPGLEVQIPRFSHRSVINATGGLQRMGLKDLFDAEKADLRGLNGVANELYLSDILQINSFATCAETSIGDAHHSEIYPATSKRSFRRRARKMDFFSVDEDEPRDYQRAFHDPLHDPTYLSLPLSLRPRQARLPETPRLRFDRPFLYFVRHNPTGLILHMGRFNPRLLP